jgi:hypothetical protein
MRWLTHRQGNDRAPAFALPVGLRQKIHGVERFDHASL